MRSNAEHQSCASAPPAPAWISKRQSQWSYGPFIVASNSKASKSASRSFKISHASDRAYCSSSSSPLSSDNKLSAASASARERRHAATRSSRDFSRSSSAVKVRARSASSQKSVAPLISVNSSVRSRAFPSRASSISPAIRALDAASRDASSARESAFLFVVGVVDEPDDDDTAARKVLGRRRWNTRCDVVHATTPRIVLSSRTTAARRRRLRLRDHIRFSVQR
mmetsp:Transcript_13013/g.39311  ORF Transcript_13013/g.39311 Transcript_13013/m.39311 type:complete len:224 (+) Transcript_13013:2476-3147(+)